MLKKLIVNNFLSFNESVFEFGKVNCLIAPNNTGKSNLIKVLEFLNVALYENIDVAISQFGGINKLQNYRVKKETIYIEAWFNLENTCLINYDLMKYDAILICMITINIKDKTSNIDLLFEGKIKGTYIFEKERINLLKERVFNDDISSVLTTYEQSIEKLNQKRYSKFLFAYSSNSASYKRDYINDDKFKLVSNLLNLQLNTKKELLKPLNLHYLFNSDSIFSSYYFIPNNIKSGQMFDSSNLNKFGQNLTYFLSSLDDDTFNNISTALIGEVELVNGIKIEDEDVKKLYFVEDINGEEKLIPLYDISDGTIHFTAIMTAIYSNPNSLSILIEEPERNMHMKTLSYILNTMRDSEKQIFFTTHSTEILQQLKLDEILFMFRDYDGNTQGQRAKNIPHIKKFMKMYKNDLVEMIQTGIVGEYEED
jgi:predicted ATPase